MKFEIFSDGFEPILTEKDDIKLELSIDTVGSLRWQAIDKKTKSIVARSWDGKHHIVMTFENLTK